MDFSRSLLLKGLGGLAAVGAVGGGGGVYVMGVLKSKEEEKKAIEEARKKVNDKLETLGLGEECRLGEDEDPYTITKECGLDEGKLKNIKFSNKGEGDLTVKGWPSEGSVKINIERKDKEGEISFSFTGVTTGSDIKIFGDGSKGKIILRDGRKFKEVDGKLTKDSSGVDATLKSKLEEFNKQLETVKAPIECRFDESEKEESLECPITSDEFKGLKFSGVGDGDLRVEGEVPAGLKLKVERNDKEDISLSFTGLSQNLTIYGSDTIKGKIIVKNSGEGIKKFKVKDGKLTKGDSDETLKKFNDQLGKVNAPVECRFDEVETEDSVVECGLTEAEFKALNFSNKSTTEELIVKTWPASGGVKLKAEKNAQNEMSLSFTGLSENLSIYGEKTKGKIVVKTGAKFTVVEDKLTKENQDAEIKKFNEQLGKVNAPIECRFDEAETEESVECSVTSEQFKTMVFSKDKDKKEVTYTQGEGFQNMKLLLRFNTESRDGENPTDVKVFYLTFKDFSETVKFKYSESGKDENVSLVKGTNPEFRIREESVEANTSIFLNKIWDADVFEDLLGLTCNLLDDATQTDCSFTEEKEKNGGEKKIKVGKGTDGEFEELTITDTTNNKFKLHKDEEGFNQGFKFAYTGTKVPAGDGSGVSLENNSNYEFKWKLKDKTKVGYLVKKEGS